MSVESAYMVARAEGLQAAEDWGAAVGWVVAED